MTEQMFTERELFAAHGLAYPTSAQIAENRWTKFVEHPLVPREQAPDDGHALASNNQTPEAFV